MEIHAVVCFLVQASDLLCTWVLHKMGVLLHVCQKCTILCPFMYFLVVASMEIDVGDVSTLRGLASSTFSGLETSTKTVASWRSVVLSVLLSLRCCFLCIRDLVSFSATCIASCLVV